MEDKTTKEEKPKTLRNLLFWAVLITAVILSVYVGALAADMTGAAIAGLLGAGAAKAVAG